MPAVIILLVILAYIGRVLARHDASYLIHKEIESKRALRASQSASERS